MFFFSVFVCCSYSLCQNIYDALSIRRNKCIAKKSFFIYTCRVCVSCDTLHSVLSFLTVKATHDTMNAIWRTHTHTHTHTHIHTYPARHNTQPFSPMHSSKFQIHTLTQRNTQWHPTPQHHNTTTPQHNNTTTQQHHNTTTPHQTQQNLDSEARNTPSRILRVPDRQTSSCPGRREVPLPTTTTGPRAGGNGCGRRRRRRRRKRSTVWGG